MAHIGGKPDGDRHELLEALYLTGNNDIFGTPVMAACASAGGGAPMQGGTSVAQARAVSC